MMEIKNRKVRQHVYGLSRDVCASVSFNRKSDRSHVVL